MGLLQEIAKDAALRMVAGRMRGLTRADVARWVAGELSVADEVVRDHGREFRAWKEIVLETLDAVTPDELLAACRTARPDLADLLDTPEARAKMAAERERGRALVQEA